ncbi:MAG: hypothetical protein AAFR02_06135, partial [Pseudomonadota bacterium]
MSRPLWILRLLSRKQCERRVQELKIRAKSRGRLLMSAQRNLDWFDPEVTTFGDRLAGAREAAG